MTIVSWKTSAAGLGAILTALADVAHSIGTGTAINWNVDIPAIIGGIGLLTAKDADVHSTQAQTQAATAVATGQPDASAMVKAADKQAEGPKP